MLNLSNILLPVDFSGRSVGAASYAGILACRFRSEVTILHVVPANDRAVLWAEPPVDYAHLRKEQLASVRQSLDSFMTDEFRGMPVKRVLLEGDPAIRIVDWAHTNSAGLIVMPTHGYGPFRRFILGSVTAKVLHDADCAVLTGVHMQDVPPPEATLFRNILCAVDLGPRSSAVLTWAAEIADAVGARLHVVHALPRLDAGQARYFDQDWRLRLESSARESIAELQSQLKTSADAFFDSGDVPKVIHSAVERVNADVVVIGRHQAHGELLGRLRAHAYSIIRESPCPVISI
jgi:nucleotide-binding universal stress UspA family protein